MQPLPQIAGAAGAATGCIQMTIGAVVSGLVAASMMDTRRSQ
jgi:MFS transporter, DHA1 family, multidrug resistance protein